METQKIRLLGRQKRPSFNHQPVHFATCREKNFSVYLHLLDVRERFLKSKKYQAWNYYSDKDIIEEHETKSTSVEVEIPEKPMGHITSVSFTKPVRQGSERKSAKRVAFSVKDKDEASEKFPYIEPSSRASSQTRAMTKLSDVTFGSKLKSPGRKSAISTTSSTSRDDELFQLTFRGCSRESQRRYDPRSELHSDYYSIKKVSTSSKLSKQERQVSFPESKQSFQAVLMGSPKRMIKKYDESNLKLPYYSWNKTNRVSSIRGYTSVPVF